MHMPAVLVGTRRLLLARLIANGLAQAGAALATAHFVHAILHASEARTADALGSLLAPAVGLGCAALLIAALRVRERVDAERMGQHYVTELRLALFECLARRPIRAIEKRSRGALVLRFVGDLRALRQWVTLGVARVTVTMIGTALVLSVLVFVDAPIALGTASVIAVGWAALHVLGEGTRDAVREARRRQSQLAANVTEKIATMGVVQVFDQCRRERRRLARQSAQVEKAVVAQARRSAALRSVSDFTAAAANGVALLIGAWQALHGAATVAEVVAAMSAISVLVPGLRDVGRASGYFNAARVSRQKLEQFLAEPVLVNSAGGAPALVPGGGAIEFRGVCVTGSLINFTAVAPAGKTIAIVGPNGGGKSTLLATAARLIDADAGQVLLDGQDVAVHDLGSVRRAIGLVSGELPLLRGTIEKNVRYRWPDAEEDDVRRVLSLCRIDEAIAELPNGLATRVNDGAANLSLGQRQRIALARALLGNPAVLLLDEADANLDPRSTAVIDQVIERFAGTVLTVTHRYERAMRADVLWYVENGRLLEAGAPADVLCGSGPAAQLFRARLRLAS
jgi:ABC-type multidrug transport system fused ATPase/permease subunit